MCAIHGLTAESAVTRASSGELTMPPAALGAVLGRGECAGNGPHK